MVRRLLTDDAMARMKASSDSSIGLVLTASSTVAAWVVVIDSGQPRSEGQIAPPLGQRSADGTLGIEGLIPGAGSLVACRSSNAPSCS